MKGAVGPDGSTCASSSSQDGAAADGKWQEKEASRGEALREERAGGVGRWGEGGVSRAMV